ncbi:Ig-like domain-containing protein [Microbacterium sp. NPDC088619]|uniref:Ig-like domain-containing protein n=1 Tax=Microbacterium sp. NPDC088619 TaxID=3364196 RepID=UPI0038150836
MTGERGFVRTHGRTVGAAAAINGEMHKRRGRGAVAIIVGMVMAVAGLLGSVVPAAAAPTVTYPGAIGSVSLENENGGGPLVQWQTVRISGEWAVPVGAQAGETFGMTLPAEFSRQSAGEFTIADPVTGLVVANCAVAAGAGPDMVCTLTEAVEGLEEVGGSFWMEARASQTTTSETVEFDLGDTVEIVDLPGDGGVVPEDPAEEEAPYKYGGETATDGMLKWVIGIPSGYVDDGSFTITDTLDGDLTGHHYTGDVKLIQRAVVNGEFVGDWSEVDSSAYVIDVADDGRSFEFTASGLPVGGFAYELVYFTQADAPVAEGDVFGNHATVDTFETSATHTVVESGGGDGSGVAYTTFSITKEVTGAQADAARDATYTVRYSVKGSDAPPTTMSVPVGQPVVSARAPLGSTFVIEEIDLPEIQGVTWGEWTIVGEGVVDGGDGTYEVTPGTTAGVELTLTNVANRTPVVTPTPTPTPTPVNPTPTPTPVTPTPTPTPVTPTPTPTPVTTPTATPTPVAGGLALTGGESGAAFLSLAFALIVGGALATGIAAKRRSSAARR